MSEILDAISENGKIISKRCRLQYLQQKNLLEKFEIATAFMEDYPLSYKFLALKLGLTKKPICIICGKNVGIDGDRKERKFRKYCGKDCYKKDPNLRNIRKKQWLKIDKIKANEKRKNTLKEKYGFEYNTQRPDIKEKVCISKLPSDILEKLNDYSFMKKLYLDEDLSGIEIGKILNIDYSTVLKYCTKHGFPIKRNYNISSQEKLLKKLLEEKNLVVETNRFDIIPPKEIDLWLPDYNVGIEINGLYWHSDHNKNKRNKYRHKEKADLAKEKNITLLQFFSDELEEKQDIILSMILAKCGVLEKIGARKCILKDLTPAIAKKFFNENHLQGHIRASIYKGLFYKDKLIAAISAGKARYEKQNSLELYRFSVLRNYAVIGGLSKLLKSLDSDIISYADRRYSTGIGYSKIGHIIKITPPNYFYVDKTKTKRFSRQKFQKHKLEKILDNYDSSKSEYWNMIANDYRIIYDCGNLKYFIPKILS